MRFCLENAASLPTTTTMSTQIPPSPLDVTLAWTDRPPSPAAASALVNDLDLEVTLPGGGATLLGNEKREKLIFFLRLKKKKKSPG